MNRYAVEVGAGISRRTEEVRADYVEFIDGCAVFWKTDDDRIYKPTVLVAAYGRNEWAKVIPND